MFKRHSSVRGSLLCNCPGTVSESSGLRASSLPRLTPSFPKQITKKQRDCLNTFVRHSTWSFPNNRRPITTAFSRERRLGQHLDRAQCSLGLRARAPSHLPAGPGRAGSRRQLRASPASRARFGGSRAGLASTRAPSEWSACLPTTDASGRPFNGHKGEGQWSPGALSKDSKV